MKKILYFVTLTLGVILLSGCTNKSEFIEYIDPTQLKELIANEETFILNLSSADCSACNNLEPRLVNVLNEYEVPIKRIDIVKYKEKDFLELYESVEFTSTPTLIFFTDGIEEDESTRIIGAVSEDKLINDFKNMNFIEEK